jgi:tryptophan synthase alpha chain
MSNIDNATNRAIDRIEATFARTRQEGRAALMPYFTLGFPNIDASLAIVEAIAHAGADLIELGVPFSDPLADGPTIQGSTQVALENGVTVRKCLEMVGKLRARGVQQPLLLMGYTNPILAYGVGNFFADAAAAGADGFIVPDLPPEEAIEMEAACDQHGCALVYLLSPTSTMERISLVSERSNGFVYLVSVSGVTGARQQLPPDLAAFVQRVRSVTSKPLAVGFGISTPEQASLVGKLADGVIVGSALIDATKGADAPHEVASDLVQGLRGALNGQDISQD